eukprot:11431372-Alexandrium_andersonii.AAC.1
MRVRGVRRGLGVGEGRAKLRRDQTRREQRLVRWQQGKGCGRLRGGRGALKRALVPMTGQEGGVGKRLRAC